MTGMQKRILALLAVSVMLCGCRTHEHIWTEPTCTEPKTCTVCGETEGAALGHDWKEPTCTEPKTCARCGETEGAALGHDWKEPTCTEPKTCARCGATEGEALGHDYTDATCIEEGVCRRCGETVPAKGHDWNDATCMRPKTCARCGAVEGDALGHDMIDGVCSRCGFRTFEPMRGQNNAVLTDVQTGSGVYRMHLRQQSGADFTVWAYDAQGTADLLTCVRGKYDASVLLFGTAPYTLEVFSSGRWEITVEQLDKTDDTAFSGTGDAVTDIFAGDAAAYRFVHTGENDFVVWVYTAEGEMLLVHELGACSVEKTVPIPENGLAFFAIRADGAWTIEPAGN